MDMKVYDRNSAGVAGPAAGRTGEAPKTDRLQTGGAGASTQGGAGDRVEFSGTLGRLSEALSSQGSQRAAKVAALAQAYSTGNYRPNSAATSKAMVSEALSAAGNK